MARFCKSLPVSALFCSYSLPDILYTNQMERMKDKHFILRVNAENERFISARTNKSRKETEGDVWLQGLQTGCCPILYLIN